GFLRCCRAQLVASRPLASAQPWTYTFLSMTRDIKARLAAQPFVAFTIHVADGREYAVSTPDHAHVYPSGGRVSVFTDDDREFILPALLISGLALSPSDSNSQ